MLSSLKTILTLLVFSSIMLAESSNTGNPQTAFPSTAVRESVRKDFYSSIEDEDANDKFIARLNTEFKKELESNSPFFVAYYGAAETLIGKHAWNPVNKLKYLHQGMAKIDDVIKKFPNDLEVRFLRFSILHHLPSILGYSEETEADVKKLYELLLQKNYTVVDAKLQKGMLDFVIDTERLTEQQNTKLREIYNLLP
mgnify:CR=1 FL=1